MTDHVVALLGGLGNQLFQVSFGRWLEDATGRDVYFDCSFYGHVVPDILSVPEIGGSVQSRLIPETCDMPVPVGDDLKSGCEARVARGPTRIVRMFHNPIYNVSDPAEPSWWFGYWHRALYAERLLQELEPVVAAAKPASAPTLGVHVRRGDMMGKPMETPASWFALAVERLALGSEASVVVWSDDPRWCHDRLDLGVPFEVAGPGSPFEHLAALAGCENLIISRSTFSWWPATLVSRRGGQVMYPAPWFGKGSQLLEGWNQEASAAIPSRWVPVPCPDEQRA